MDEWTRRQTHRSAPMCRAHPTTGSADLSAADCQQMRAGKRTASGAELMEMAEQRQTLDMVMACRQAASFLREAAAGT